MAVGGVQVRVEQADGEGFGPAREGVIEGPLHAGRVEGHEHRAVGGEPLDDFEPMPPLHHRLWPDEGGHEEGGNVSLGAPDLDQVAEAGRGHHGHARATPLEHRVGADGGAVDEAPDVAALDAQGLEPGQDGAGLVAR